MIPFIASLTKSFNKIDLYYLQGGQSNADGRTDGVPPSLSLQGTIDKAFIYDVNDSEDKAYKPLNYGVNNKGDLFAHELSLCKNYTNYTNRIMFMEKQAIGGTAIAQLIDEPDWNVLSNQYIIRLENSTNRLKNKMISEAAQNPKYVFSWIQGERDAKLGIETGALWQQNFTEIIAYIDNLRVLDVIIVGILSSDISIIDYPDRDIVRAQQLAYVASEDRAIAIDLNNYTLGVDGLHFNAESQERIGNDIFKIIKLKLL